MRDRDELGTSLMRIYAWAARIKVKVVQFSRGICWLEFSLFSCSLPQWKLNGLELLFPGISVDGNRGANLVCLVVNGLFINDLVNDSWESSKEKLNRFQGFRTISLDDVQQSSSCWRLLSGSDLKASKRLSKNNSWLCSPWDHFSSLWPSPWNLSLWLNQKKDCKIIKDDSGCEPYASINLGTMISVAPWSTPTSR